MSSRSSVDRAPTRCLGGHGFDSCRGLRFFSLFPRSCHGDQLNFYIDIIGLFISARKKSSIEKIVVKLGFSNISTRNNIPTYLSPTLSPMERWCLQQWMLLLKRHFKTLQFVRQGGGGPGTKLLSPFLRITDWLTVQIGELILLIAQPVNKAFLVRKWCRLSCRKKLCKGPLNH